MDADGDDKTIIGHIAMKEARVIAPFLDQNEI